MVAKIEVNLEAIPKPKRGRPRRDESVRLQQFGCLISGEAEQALRATAEKLQVSQGALIEAFARSLANGQIAA